MAYPKTYNPCDDCPYSFSKNNQESNMCKICEFNQLLDKPTADVVEVKHGEWKHECVECSVCKRNISEICDADSYLTSGIEYELLFCPFCGAKMDGGKAE
jgi:hypothetical protein